MIETFHLYITATQVHARRQSGWRQQIHPLAEWEWDAASPASLSFKKIPCKKILRPNLHVHLGSALCKFMTVDLPAGLHNVQEQSAAGQAQMQYQLGLSASDWVFTLNRPRSPAEFVSSLVCAVRRPVIERLQELSKDSGLRLVSLKPYIAGVWNAVQAGPRHLAQLESALLAIEHDAFTLFVGRAGTLESMNTLSHVAEPDLIEREIKRLGYSLGRAVQDTVRLVLAEGCLTMAQAHADKILVKSDYLKKPLYADFRDLLFHADEEHP